MAVLPPGNSDRTEVVLLLVLILIIAIVGVLALDEQSKSFVCKRESTVTKILSVEYRDATFEFANGDVMQLSQVTLKPGDTYCLVRERK